MSHHPELTCLLFGVAGKLSRAEWIAKYGTDAGFDAYDLDGDGFVDAQEFVAAQDTNACTQIPRMRRNRVCVF